MKYRLEIRREVVEEMRDVVEVDVPDGATEVEIKKIIGAECGRVEDEEGGEVVDYSWLGEAPEPALEPDLPGEPPEWAWGEIPGVLGRWATNGHVLFREDSPRPADVPADRWGGKRGGWYSPDMLAKVDPGWFNASGPDHPGGVFQARYAPVLHGADRVTDVGGAGWSHSAARVAGVVRGDAVVAVLLPLTSGGPSDQHPDVVDERGEPIGAVPA